MTPTHLAPPSAYHATKPPHLPVEQSASIKPRSCHSSRASRDSCHANTILDPPRESFQLSGRSPIRCMKHKRSIRECMLHSCSCARLLSGRTRLCAKGSPKALKDTFMLFSSSTLFITSFFSGSYCPMCFLIVYLARSL